MRRCGGDDREEREHLQAQWDNDRERELDDERYRRLHDEETQRENEAYERERELDFLERERERAVDKLSDLQHEINALDDRWS